MPVVINDFEVIPEAAPASENAGPAGHPGGNETQNLPDLPRIIEQSRERAERVRAH